MRNKSSKWGARLCSLYCEIHYIKIRYIKVWVYKKRASSFLLRFFLAKKKGFTQKLAQKHMQKNLEPQEIGAYYFFGGEWICILKMMSGLHFFQPRLLFSKLKELRAIYELILRPPALVSIVWDSSAMFFCVG